LQWRAVRLNPGTPLAERLIAEVRVERHDIGLKPAFYVESAIAGFLPHYLQLPTRAAGNWLLPGRAPPLLPSSQRLLRALSVSGPLWRRLRFRWMHRISRAKFHRPATNWGVPNQRRYLL